MLNTLCQGVWDAAKDCSSNHISGPMQLWLTMVNSEEGPGVVFRFLGSARYVPAQEVKCLVSAMARHFLISNHLQQREEDGL